MTSIKIIFKVQELERILNSGKFVKWKKKIKARRQLSLSLGCCILSLPLLEESMKWLVSFLCFFCPFQFVSFSEARSTETHFQGYRV